MNYPTLVLNSDFSPLTTHPLSVWSFERTLKNLMKGRITPLEYHDAVLRSPSVEYIPPSVVALKKYVNHKSIPAFNRMNIFLRDEFECQYCANEFSSDELTFDHVIPRRDGGKTCFENIVTSCHPCNTKKGHRRDIKPIREPITPKERDLAKARTKLLKKNQILHETWFDYLYWSGVLEKD